MNSYSPTSTSAAQPIKILYCIDKLIRGGTELQLVGMIERLDPQHYQPYLLTIRESDSSLVPPNCTALAWHVPSLLSPAGITALIRLIKFLRREKISIVQTYFQDSTLFAGLAAWLARTPVRIACFRDLGFWLTPRQKFAFRYLYKTMTGFICNANMVKSHFSKIFSINPKKMAVIGNGVDTQSLHYVEHHGPCQHIGIVGNMTRPVKRTDLFIKAAALVHKNHPNICWHILGDGHLRPELEQLAEQLGVAQQLYFAGRIDDIPAYLEKLDIGVICSDSEGLSNALIEYMLKGVASVATAVGGNPELIEHEKNGLLVPANNAEALAQAIQFLIENNSQRHQFTQQARRWIEQNYDWSICLKNHDAFYLHQLKKDTAHENP